jgi:hypothetical protein
MTAAASVPPGPVAILTAVWVVVLMAGQGRAQPLQQVRTCLGGHDAARRAVEQPDAELLFEPSNRFAKR